MCPSAWNPLWWLSGLLRIRQKSLICPIRPCKLWFKLISSVPSSNDFCHMLVQPHELLIPGEGIQLSSQVLFGTYTCETFAIPFTSGHSKSIWSEYFMRSTWDHLVTTKLHYFILHYQLGPEQLIKLSWNEVLMEYRETIQVIIIFKTTKWQQKLK